MVIVYGRKVNFYETDAQGIVHHSNYPRYFEECRGLYLEKLGLPYNILRSKYNIDIVLLELDIRYKNMLKFGDSFNIEFWLKDIDSYFFSFEYRVINNKEIAYGITKHCCIRSDTKKIIKIPDLLKSNMEKRNG